MIVRADSADSIYIIHYTHSAHIHIYIYTYVYIINKIYDFILYLVGGILYTDSWLETMSLFRERRDIIRT